MAGLVFLYDVNREGNLHRDRENNDIFDKPEDYLLKRYRLSGQLIRSLCEGLGPDLESQYRGTNVAVATQIATALRVLGEGNFQRPSGDLNELSQPTVSRILERFCNTVVEKYLKQCITFPETQEEIQRVKDDFNEKYGIPNVIGCIDCTHVNIKAPSVNEHLFVNRHQEHSINVQAIVNANMEFTDVVAKFPGGAHDSFIFRQSARGQQLAASEGNTGYLLADRGYALRSWILIPFSEQEKQGDAARCKYNEIHCSCRALVERAFGVLKSRFRLVGKLVPKMNRFAELLIVDSLAL